jgi:hypothetical protein
MAKMVKIERYDFTIHIKYSDMKVGESHELCGAPGTTIGVVPIVRTNVKKAGIITIESLKIGVLYVLYKGKNSHELITPIDAWELSVHNQNRTVTLEALPSINSNILIVAKITRKGIDEEDQTPYFGITFHSETKVVNE